VSLDEDRKAEAVVGIVLRGGVALAASIVFAGAVLYLFKHGLEKVRYGTFTGEAADLRLPAGIFRRALGGGPRGIIQAGLLILIATPIARVAASAYLFARRRDRLYVAFTLAVLSVLIYSLASGIRP
jgi:uncharacterized membrane protein